MSNRISRTRKLFAECLEDRCNPSGLSAEDQYFLELMNRARANPAAEAARFGIALNEGLFPGTIANSPLQPLASITALQTSIDGHLAYLAATGVFSHTGPEGLLPIGRAGYQGYVTSYIAENLAYQTGSLSTAALDNLHRSLFVDAGVAGRSHRLNLLTGMYRDVGVGVTTGLTAAGSNGVIVGQDLGYRQGSSVVLTGVAYVDSVIANQFYTIGEGLPGVTVTAQSGGQTYSTTTFDGGGYSLPIPGGAYTVTFTNAAGQQLGQYAVSVGGSNVKLDYVGTTSPVSPPPVSPPPVSPPPVSPPPVSPPPVSPPPVSPPPVSPPPVSPPPVSPPPVSPPPVSPPPAVPPSEGFETPAVGTGSYGSFQYAPAGSAWTFSGGAGVAGNGSGFTSGNPSAPDGTQVAFVQGNGNVSRSVSLAAGTYTATFRAAQRGNYQASLQAIRVLIDGSPVGTVTPAGIAYTGYGTAAFTVAAGAHTLTFLGVNPNGGDNTAFLDQFSVIPASSPSVPSVGGSGFEMPAVGTGSYGSFQYGPAGTAWAFTGGAGVAGNGSGFTSGNASAPEGTQVAFLQGGGSFSQSVTMAAGTYTVSFQAAQRGNYQSSYQAIRVLVDGNVVGTVTPAGTAYAGYTTAAFTVAAGAHTLTFQGVNPNGGDNTAFLDLINILPG